MEAKWLRMTMAGPPIMRIALYQPGNIGRRWDPQLACVYYREMVHHGKNHKQAMGAAMSHLGARVLSELKEDRHYRPRDVGGKPIGNGEARRIILSEYQVPEEIRKERRRRKSKKDRAQSVRLDGGLALAGHTRQPQLLNLHNQPAQAYCKASSPGEQSQVYP